MAIYGQTLTDAEGLLESVLTDAQGVVISRQALPMTLQPANVRRSREAQEAVRIWRLAEDARAFHAAQGQSYYDLRAPGAGLPTGTAAYNTATTFVTNTRDRAWERALAAINRWRIA